MVKSNRGDISVLFCRVSRERLYNLKNENKEQIGLAEFKNQKIRLIAIFLLSAMLILV